MYVANIPVTNLTSQYTGELLMRTPSKSVFERVKSVVDTYNMICFIEEENIIYAQGHEYKGISEEQANNIGKILSIETLVNSISEKIKVVNDGNSIIGELSYSPIFFTDNGDITEQNVTNLIKSVCNMLEQGASKLDAAITNAQDGLNNLQDLLSGFSEGDTSLKEYIDIKINDINNDLQKLIDLQKLSLSGDNEHIEVEQDPENQYRYLIKGKDIASNTELQALSKQVSNIFGEVDSNIKEIVKEELEASLIPSNASESMNTIAKIAQWIQSHPNEYKDLYTQLNLIQETIGSMDEYAKKGNLYEPNGDIKTINGDINYATTLEEVNEILKSISFATNVEDNAEHNWLVGINIDDQTFTIKGKNVQFTSESGTQSDTAKFIKAFHNSDTRILDFGLETKQLETVIDKSIDTATDEVKTYVESRLSWNVK